MKLFNSSQERLVPSNMAFTQAEASQIMLFIEAIFFFCEGKTNGTRKCGMAVLVIMLQKKSGSTVLVAWSPVWLDRLVMAWPFTGKNTAFGKLLFF